MVASRVPGEETFGPGAAAAFLGISRHALMRLLADGEIEYETSSDGTGAHRRVRLGRLLAYQEKRRRRRDELLGGILDDAVEFGEYG